MGLDIAGWQWSEREILGEISRKGSDLSTHCQGLGIFASCDGMASMREGPLRLMRRMFQQQEQTLSVFEVDISG